MSNETDHDLPPFMTARAAAAYLGYAPSSTVLTRLIRDEKTRPEGTFKSGGCWMIPTEWVLAKKEADEASGIVRGKKGRPVTTGAGKQRKDRGGPGGTPYKNQYISTGRPPGRPKKSTES